MGKLLKLDTKSLVWNLWLAFFLALALLFLLYHLNKAENEVSLERTKKEEHEKPFMDVAGTGNDLRSCPVGLQ